MSLQSLLNARKFAVTAEVGPLKGTDTTEMEEVAGLLKGKVDAANVTDQQSSVMRLGSLATCHMLKERGLAPIFQVTCRDRNRLALQSDLLSAYVLGIENILAITGCNIFIMQLLQVFSLFLWAILVGCLQLV